MNFEFFIARRITRSQDVKDTIQKGTRPIIKIAILSIALGLAIMILAVAIVTGFQHEIRSKVIGFGSHIIIQNMGTTTAMESTPVSIHQPFYPSLDSVEGIRHIQQFAIKPGIIKTDAEVYGVILKGIGSDYDWSFFKKNLIKGTPLDIVDSLRTDKVIISRAIGDKLRLRTGDRFRMFFIQEPVRQRKFEVAGIYVTGMEQLDKQFILADIKHVQSLNNWDDTLVSGFEVLLDDFKSLEKMDEFIYSYIGMELNSVKITDQFKEIFGWLELLDMNVWVILLFAVLVAGINMITALLILILERTQMIGLLKALGAQNNSIRKIFLINAAYLIGKGLFWGNVIGIALGVIQQQFQLITLPQETYYIHVVPVNLNVLNIALLNAGTFLLCLTMLILPSYVITKITPVKALRFN